MKQEELRFDTVVIKEADSRDYSVAMFVPNQDKIPDEEFILDMPEVEMILDQGATGSCVAHTFAVAATILNWQITNKIVQFSPMALYGTRDVGHYRGVGMVPSEAAYVVRKEGLFYRRDFDERHEVPQILDSVREFKSNNPEKVKEAKKFQIGGYARIYTGGSTHNEQIKKALKNRMPVAGMWPLYESFYKTPSSGKVPVPNKNSEEYLGNHEMLIVGWTRNREWIVINSWGLNRGLKGIYLIPFSYQPQDLISISDTICPCKPKAKKIVTVVGSNVIDVDGVDTEVAVAPYISNEDRTMVPVRFISEFLGASVEWIEDNQRVVIRSEEHNIEMTIGSNDYYIDKVRYRMDTNPVVKNDRTFLPIRYIAEALKCKIDYHQEDDKEIIEIHSL